MMRIVFMGSAEVSCTVLRSLLAARYPVAGVVTQPDRPAGRNQRLTPCACRTVAEAAGLEVLTPEKVNRPEWLERIQAWAPELIVVVAYGQFLGQRLLALPPRGCINVHLSLLPRHRGAAPIQRAIAAGDDVSGVTTMLMDAGMDSGDILMQAEEPIRPDDTGGTLHDRLAEAGSGLLLATLPEWEAGRLVPRKQDPERVTFAPKISKEEGRLDWSRPASELALRVRAFNPWPACYTHLPGSDGTLHRLKVLAAAVDPAAGVPGRVLAADDSGLLVAAGAGSLRLHTVQPEGRRPMDAASFLRGHRLPPGATIRA